MDVGDARRLPAVLALNEHYVGALAKKPRWAWVFAASLGMLVVGALRGVEMEAMAGTQQCNTECQSRMTDCILACDGMRSCEEVCKKKGQSCVSVCTSDAGPEVAAVLDGAVEAPSVGEIFDARSDARASKAKDGSTRAAARDR